MGRRAVECCLSLLGEHGRVSFHPRAADSSVGV
jgi:hypothetical protein